MSTNSKRKDPHVHLRGLEQSRKCTIEEGIALGLSQGVDVMIDEPNKKRPVVDRHGAQECLDLVPPNWRKHYRLNVGLTGDKGQIVEAIWCVKNIHEVAGLKLYAGRSVGDLSVIDEGGQRLDYQTCALHDFTGVMQAHCEEETEMFPDLWKSSEPWTHGLARPPKAEIISVRQQIRLAQEEGYQGKLHICHVSCPESVIAINEAKKAGMQISCGVTPHHLLWSDEAMRGSNGLWFKVNPPLRSAAMVRDLIDMLVAGMIDLIETDHAPHTEQEKGEPLCLSGIPSLNFYDEFVKDFLLKKLGLPEARVRELTCDNALAIWGEKLEI